MQDILQAFPAVLKHLDPEGNAVEPVVFAAWKRVVEGTLSENILPLKLEKNRLFVAVADETWRRQVADLGPAIARRINKAVGTNVVSFIEFQADAEVINKRKKSLVRNEALASERSGSVEMVRTSLEPACESIRDERLRETFLAAAAGSLARNKPTAEG